MSGKAVSKAFSPGEFRIRKQIVLFKPLLRLKELQIIGQLNNQFLVAKMGGSLVLLDQHAIHERIRLERFLTSLKPGCKLSATKIDFKLSLKLKALGFEPFRIPTLFSQLSERDLRRGIQETEGCRVGLIGETFLEALKSQACRGAIKFGESLSLETMNSLVKDLIKCQYPTICAHGRPSIKLLSW